MVLVKVNIAPSPEVDIPVIALLTKRRRAGTTMAVTRKRLLSCEEAVDGVCKNYVRRPMLEI